MTVKEIIEKYLKDNGFDGLAGLNCGCKMGVDCMCCGWDGTSCEPGYLTPCDKDCDCGGYHITTIKPETGESEESHE